MYVTGVDYSLGRGQPLEFLGCCSFLHMLKENRELLGRGQCINAAMSGLGGETHRPLCGSALTGQERRGCGPGNLLRFIYIISTSFKFL